MVLRRVMVRLRKQDGAAAGAHLVNAAASGKCGVSHWCEGNFEVDFVLQAGRRLLAVDVKSGRAALAQSGLFAFAGAHAAGGRRRRGAGGVPGAASAGLAAEPRPLR